MRERVHTRYTPFALRCAFRAYHCCAAVLLARRQGLYPTRRVTTFNTLTYNLW